MESFGSYLKGLREEKGKTLEDISASTKIALTNLDFLENDRYDLLPPIVFVKGFVKSYAKELDLDTDDTIKTLETFLSATQPQNYNDDKPLIPVEEGASWVLFCAKYMVYKNSDYSGFAFSVNPNSHRYKPSFPGR